MTKRHVDIDDDLLERVKVYLGTRTIKSTVNQALREILAGMERCKEVEYWLTDPYRDLRQLMILEKKARQEFDIWSTRVRSYEQTFGSSTPSSDHCSIAENSPPAP